MGFARIVKWESCPMRGGLLTPPNNGRELAHNSLQLRRPSTVTRSPAQSAQWRMLSRRAVREIDRDRSRAEATCMRHVLLAVVVASCASDPALDESETSQPIADATQYVLPTLTAPQ